MSLQGGGGEKRHGVATSRKKGAPAPVQKTGKLPQLSWEGKEKSTAKPAAKRKGEKGGKNCGHTRPLKSEKGRKEKRCFGEKTNCTGLNLEGEKKGLS